MPEDNQRSSPPDPKLTNPEILENTLENALRQIKRPAGGLLLGGISAGLNLSFGALFMGIALTFSAEFSSLLVKQFVLANASVIGFIIVVIGQSELFTAHSTMGILPLLDRRASLSELGRLWSIIYIGNMIGCIIFAALIAVLGPALNVVTPKAFASLAHALLPFSGTTIFLSGIIAGWLMGMVVWLTSASRYTVGKFLIIWLLTLAIGFGPFHHCILGTTEILSAMFLGNTISAASLFHFLGWTTLGNIVGGSVFVAILNYGQSAKAGNPKDVDITDQ